MLTVVSIAAATVFVLYALMLLVLWRYQERIVFQPPAWPVADKAEALERLTYDSDDGVRLFAWVVGDPSSRGPVILAFHGNAVVARSLIPWARDLTRRFGARVVLPEYRGYDGLRGRPTYAGVSLDASAALDATAKYLGAETSDVVVFGHSLGSAVATEIAATSSVGALILQSPFTSAMDIAGRWRIAGLQRFWQVISRVHYDTVGRVRTLEAPVHVAHGTHDLVIPVRMGRDVFTAARLQGALLIVNGAGHNDVPEVGGDSYWAWMEQALGPKAR